MPDLSILKDRKYMSKNGLPSLDVLPSKNQALQFKLKNNVNSKTHSLPFASTRGVNIFTCDIKSLKFTFWA